MSDKEAERAFLERVSEYLLSLPFDLKILQEAVADPDLEKNIRLLAASTVVHTILPQDGEPGPLRYVDDVFFVRAALDEVGRGDSEGAVAFRERFGAEIYDRLAEDLQIFSTYLGRCGRGSRASSRAFTSSRSRAKSLRRPSRTKRSQHCSTTKDSPF